MFKLTSETACPCSQQKGNKHATTLIAKVDTMLSPRPGVSPEGHCQPGDGSHSTDQPKGTEVSHAGLSVGFSKVIPANDTSKTEYSNTQHGLSKFGYT
jgi:GTP cyclohydrolase FolE2